MIKEAIYKLINHEDLTYEESLAVMGEMMDGTATQAQMGGFLTALRMQGETIDEITAFATVMREKGVKLHPERDVMEIVGTGGDEVGTFNISTTSAFVVAAAGIPVAKHGNRSISSRSGAADVLENLGAKMQLLGVYDKDLAPALAQVLSNLGVTRGVAVCGDDGLDEITLTGKTYVNEIRNGEIISYTITPEQFGLKSCELSELIGGTPKENAEITRRILTGEETGPKRDVILMNAGMSLYLGIDGITLAEGIEKAKEMIDSGKAYAKLQEFVKATQEA